MNYCLCVDCYDVTDNDNGYCNDCVESNCMQESV